MAKHISLNHITSCIFDLTTDCIKNKRMPRQQLDYSNGEQCAIMNHMLYTENPQLFWECHNHKPLTSEPSDLYITAYNKKALELGIPPHNLIDFIVVLISLVIL